MRRGRWLAIILLAGCTSGVQVRHPVAPLRLDPADLPRISRMGLVLRIAPSAAARASGEVGQVAMGQLLGALGGSREPGELEYPMSPAEGAATLRLSAARLSSPWSRIVSWEVQGPSTTSFLAVTGPGSVLWLDAGDVKAEEVEQVEKRRDGSRSSAWVCRAGWAVRWQLMRWPEGGIMASGEETSGSREAFGQPVELREWVARAGGWRVGWVDAVRDQLLPRTRLRWRRTWKDKDVRGDSSGCHAAWNEGVRAEQEGNWALAQDAYSRARAAARVDKERVDLDGYLRELSYVFSGGPGSSATGDPWFDEPIAVVPFGNETNNVGAPDIARAMVQSEMERRGYRVIPIAEADARCHAVGVSQGEQLKAVDPAKFAAALGVRRWVTGYVNEFKVINVGVYYRRQARVTLGVSDAGGRVIWQAAGTSVQQSVATSGKGIGAQLLGGLAGGLLEKLTKTYLKEDTEAAVAQAMAYLPSR